MNGCVGLEVVILNIDGSATADDIFPGKDMKIVEPGWPAV
jgi:hypothetical protein